MFNVMVSTRFQLAVLSCAFWPCQLGNKVPSFQQLDKYQVRRIAGPSLAIAGSSSFISRYKMWDRIRIKILGSAALRKVPWCPVNAVLYFYMLFYSPALASKLHIWNCTAPLLVWIDQECLCPLDMVKESWARKSEHQGTFTRLPTCVFSCHVFPSLPAKIKASESQFDPNEVQFFLAV